MDRKFYIAFIDKSHNSGKYPNDIMLRKILDYNSSIEYIENEYQVLTEFSFNHKKWTEPILITNDNLLNQKYRNVFSENEFKSYCIESSYFGNQIEKLPLKNQLIANQSNLTGNYGKETFNHFLNIKENKYKEAYMIHKYLNSWIDEDTGMNYDYDEENKWKTNDWIDFDNEFISPL